jgi:Ni/Fe-hydrogenase subunit HybB-like protein
MLKNLRSKLGSTAWMVWLAVMGIILLSGAVAGILVFWKGLVITNLTDRVPWGLWITIDLSLHCSWCRCI